MDNRAYVNMHKLRPSRFGNIALKRQVIVEQLKSDRQARRTVNFNKRRNISSESSSVVEDPDENQQPVQNKAVDRKLALLKYKAEKEAIKKSLKEKSRPPFKVGIPHHGSSPALRELSNINKGNKKELTKLPIKQQMEVNGRVTRARGKMGQGNARNSPKVPQNFKSPVQVFPFNTRKTVFNFNLTKSLNKKKLTSPNTPEVLKRSVQKKIVKQIVPHNLAKPIPKAKPSTSSTDSGELAVPLPAPTEESLLDLQNSQPLIAKASTGTEEIQNPVEIPEAVDHPISSKKASDDYKKLELTPSIETQRGNWSDRKRATPKRKHSPHLDTYVTVGDLQRSRLDKETNRLLELAESWEKIALQQKTPRDVQDEIDSLVGQTRLLTRDKFMQFQGLIDQFESKSGTHVITAEDLDGFWDMIYLQVEALIKRYTNLDDLKKNNWIKSEHVVKKKKGVAKKSQLKSTASSAIREAIRARRAKLAVSSPGISEESTVNITEVNERKSILSNVLSNKKRTHSNSPSAYIAMRLSSIGRSSYQTPQNSVETEDLNTTPKSILRKKLKIEHKEFTEETALVTDVMPLEESTKLTEAPRRSRRVLQISSTPSKDKVCFPCTVQWTPSQSVRKSRRLTSRLPTPNETPLDFTDVLKKEEPREAAAPSTSGKRFVLRPSTLNVNNLTSLIDPESESTCVQLRRSSRKASSAKKVIFVASTGMGEKSSMKLPVTPFRNSSRGKVSVDQDED